jgi:hypothetical protein
MGMSTGLTKLSWLRIWAVAGFSEYSDMFDKQLGRRLCTVSAMLRSSSLYSSVNANSYNCLLDISCA